MTAVLHPARPEHYFAGMAGNRSAIRPVCFFHRQLSFHKSPQLARVEKLSKSGQLFSALFHDEKRALHAWIRTGLRVCGNRHQPAARLQEPPRSLKRFAANGIENDVDAASVFKTALSVINDFVRPKLLYELDVGF